MKDDLARIQGILRKITQNSRPKVQVLRLIYAEIEKSRRKKLNKALLITTPNPEIILKASKDLNMAKIISDSVMIPDGIGVIQAIKFLSLKCPENPIKIPLGVVQGLVVGGATLFSRAWLEREVAVIKGKDLFRDLMKLANKRGFRVAFIGGYDCAQKAAAVLERGNKKVKILALTGPRLDDDGQPISKKERQIERKIIDEVGRFKPDITFVGFGAPKQEKWLKKWQGRLGCPVAMTVGRTFEWVAGVSSEAPKAFERLGLEWMWRLGRGSTNTGRIIRAVIIFPMRVYLTKIRYGSW